VLRDYNLSVARIKWASICLARSAIIRLLVPTLMLSSIAATKLARAYLYFFSGASRHGCAHSQHVDAFAIRLTSSRLTSDSRHPYFLIGSSDLEAVDHHRNPQPVVRLLSGKKSPVV
jgi:hypothetical protein